MKNSILHSFLWETPLGTMMALTDQKVLHLLEFIERRGLERELDYLQQRLNSEIVPGCTQPTESIIREMEEYFSGKLQVFKTPISMLGTPFQIDVWQALQKIPHGETRSYSNIAQAIGRPAAHRAVGTANASNQLVIVVPCHRVIQASGNIGEYASGCERKKWLLNHENSFFKENKPEMRA